MKKAIQIQNAPAPIGPYSPAIFLNDTLYVSGQIPLNPHTGDLITNNIVDATNQVLNNIEALITEAGMNKQNIVKCSIFLKDMNDFAQVNEVYAKFFEGTTYPARETVQVAKLPLDVPVEISCIAVK